VERSAGDGGRDEELPGQDSANRRQKIRHDNRSTVNAFAHRNVPAFISPSGKAQTALKNSPIIEMAFAMP
jgi:hypothetical protein